MSRKAKKKRARSDAGRKKQEPSTERDSIYSIADNLLFSGVLLILFLRPFISGRTYPHYNHFFHIAVCAVTILWLLKSYRRGKLELHDRLLTGFAGAFVVVCSITLFTTVSKGLTLRYTYEIISYTLLFLVIANNFRDRSSLKAAVVAILLAALLVNIYGIYQRYYTLEQTRLHIDAVIRSGNSDMLPGIPLNTDILHRLQSVRVFSTFLYPNAYGLFLALVGALTIGFAWSMHESMRKIVRSIPGNPFSPRPEVPGYLLSEPTETSQIAFIKSWLESGAVRFVLRAPFYLAVFAWRIGRLLPLPLFAVSCVLILWNLWLTYSRGGWLSAIVVVLVFLAVRYLRRGGIPAHKIAAMIFVAVLLVTALTSADALSADTVQVHEESVISRLRDSFSVKQRISYWRAALEMVKDNPWLGVGWGAFEKAYPRYMVLGGYPVKLAHNNYFQVWAETGIAGLNAFVGMWLVFLYTFWRKARSGAAGDLRGIACGLGAALIGFMVNSVVDFGLYLPAIMYYVYAFLGLLVAVPTDRDEKDKFVFRFPAFPAVALIVATCFFVGSIYRSYMGLSLFMRVEDERNKAFPTQFAMGKGIKPDPARQQNVLRESVKLLRRSIAYFPLSGETHHMLGDTHLRLSKMEKKPYLLSDAIRHFERAAELNPLSPEVFQSLATAYWIAGNTTEKAELFQRALEAELRASENFPVNPEYHDKLRQIYESLGMDEKAKEERRKFNELKKHYRRF